MNEFERKILWRVLGIHAALIFLMITIPMLRGCFKPKPKEINIFFDVAPAPPAVDVTAVDDMPEPEPPKVEVEDPIPEPKKPEKKKVEPPKKKDPPKKKVPPKKVEPPKPKWKPKKASDIKKGKKITVPKKPRPPSITSSDIKKMFSGLKSSSSAVSPSQFNDYYLQVYNRLYAAWTPPSAASAATRPAEVKIFMQKNGRITKRAKTAGSGDPLYDRTVMDAVNSITTLPKPPTDYPFDYVIVTFRIIE